jgi:hypothetical protein
MIRTDDLRLMQLKQTEDGSFEVALPESPDDWAYRRAAALNVVRQRNQIPDVLLNLVLEELKEQTPVRLKLRKMPDSYWKVEAEVVETEIDPSGERASMSRELGEPMPARMGWELENLMPASEALAFLLRIELRYLKYAERRSSAKARSSPHLIPRSTISDIALDLLQRSQWNYPPGDALVDLFRELLNLENPKQQYPRRLDAQECAAKMLAQSPQIGVSELAKAVRVNKSSISRWIKRSDFQAMVKRAAKGKSI